MMIIMIKWGSAFAGYKREIITRSSACPLSACPLVCWSARTTIMISFLTYWLWSQLAATTFSSQSARRRRLTVQTLQTFWRALLVFSTVWSRLRCFDLGSASVVWVSRVARSSNVSAPKQQQQYQQQLSWNLWAFWGWPFILSHRTDITWHSWTLVRLSVCPSLHLSVSPSGLWIISLIWLHGLHSCTVIGIFHAYCLLFFGPRKLAICALLCLHANWQTQRQMANE